MDGPKDLPFDRQQILDTVRGALARVGVDPAGITLATKLTDDLDMDSLDWVDLALQLEATYRVELSEERFASFPTVQDVVDSVCDALEARNARR